MYTFPAVAIESLRTKLIKFYPRYTIISLRLKIHLLALKEWRLGNMIVFNIEKDVDMYMA